VRRSKDRLHPCKPNLIRLRTPSFVISERSTKKLDFTKSPSRVNLRHSSSRIKLSPQHALTGSEVTGASSLKHLPLGLDTAGDMRCH